MDFQYMLLIIFILLMILFSWLQRKNIQLQGIFPLFYFVMWRTQKCLRFMDRLAQMMPRFWSWFFGFGIIAGFAGMVFISYELVRNTVRIIIAPGIAPGIQPVLPFEAKGVFFVPFVYWLLSIFVIAFVHEFCHGIAARVYKMPVKSAGLAFLGVLVPLVPAAFVEPDEPYLQRQGKFRQLSVFAAGPFANIVSAGIIFLIIALVANPLAESMLIPGGARVTDVEAGSPAAIAGMHKGEIITGVDSASLVYLDNLTAVLASKKPKDTITLSTNETSYTIVLAASPKNASKAYLGIFTRQHAEITESFRQRYGEWSVPVVLWIFGLLYWLFLLSMGIGLFNLLPIGPIDGGRMLQLAMQKIFKERMGEVVWNFISMVFLLLVVSNVIAGFIG
ncbi:MAG: site-2 protease family protein [Candidatus Woesearchaeota archaeon]